MDLIHFTLVRQQAKLALEYPQLAPLILHLSFTPEPAIPTCGVDESGVVHFNPKYFEGMPDTNTSQVLMHETLHLFLDYFKRREIRDNTRWNVAHDLEIAHYVRPNECVTPEQFKLKPGMLAEYYYEHLPKGKTIQCQCAQGSMKGNGNHSEDTHRAIVRTAEKIVEAGGVNFANGEKAGTESSLFKHALKIAKPTAGNNTLRQLQGSMLTSGLTDTSYERPNRRTQGHLEAVLPASVHREPNVLCILDVSGSMHSHLEKATATVLGAVKSVGASLKVVAWDTQPQCVSNVRRAEDLKRLHYSGGGTDMSAAILAAPNYGKFDAILVVTDCETPWPQAAQLHKLPPVYVLAVTEHRAPEYMKTMRV